MCPIIWAIKVVFLKGIVSSHFYMVPHLLQACSWPSMLLVWREDWKDAERRDEFCRQFAEDANFFRADRLKQMKETDKFMRMQDQLIEDKDKDESERCLRRLRVGSSPR